MKMESRKNKCDVDPWQEHDPWSRSGIGRAMDANATPFTPVAESMNSKADNPSFSTAVLVADENEKPEPVESFKTETSSCDDLARTRLYELCTLADGTLDPCRALELVMGRPTSSGYKGYVKQAEESKEQRQRSNEEAFLECWHVLGQDRNDADRIKAMLKSIWAWRHSAPATSSAQQWWQILFRRFKNEADCDKAVSDALEHLD